MLKFDMRALQDALDGERRARKLTWDQLAAEINEPFKHTPSIPISVSTLRTMTTKRSVTSAVVLQVLRWLRRTPESFLAGRDQTPALGEALRRWDLRRSCASIRRPFMPRSTHSAESKG
jgi:hypothetical protein